MPPNFQAPGQTAAHSSRSGFTSCDYRRRVSQVSSNRQNLTLLEFQLSGSTPALYTPAASGSTTMAGPARTRSVRDRTVMSSSKQGFRYKSGATSSRDQQRRHRSRQRSHNGNSHDEIDESEPQEVPYSDNTYRSPPQQQTCASESIKETRQTQQTRQAPPNTKPTPVPQNNAELLSPFPSTNPAKEKWSRQQDPVRLNNSAFSAASPGWNSDRLKAQNSVPYNVSLNPLQSP